ncbi:MAG: PTS sugar transporter subunit IIC [Treponema sp.]|jgi:mannose/fructose/N-acetylgalactosamine-specific phosphotransferase system component IIC|nr:PTS sugar transporter subunit IIC [Treponema sp.]
MFVQALLVALVFYVSYNINILGVFHFNRPIIIAPLIGLVLGDLQTGIILGATFEAIFLGVAYIGGTAPADPAVGTAFGTAIAILSDATPEAAMAIAMPVGVLAISIGMLPMSVINPILVPIAQKAAADGDEKKIIRLTMIMTLFMGLITAIVIFLGVFFGIDLINRVLENLPRVILTGLGAAGSILPAVGFALLLNIIYSKKVVVFFFLGSVLAIYLGLPSIASAVIAVVIGVYTFFTTSQVEGAGNSTGQSAAAPKNNDEEFFK